MSIDTSKVADSNTTAATAKKPNRAGAVATWADDRLGLATMMKKNAPCGGKRKALVR